MRALIITVWDKYCSPSLSFSSEAVHRFNGWYREEDSEKVSELFIESLAKAMEKIAGYQTPPKIVNTSTFSDIENLQQMKLCGWTTCCWARSGKTLLGRRKWPQLTCSTDLFHRLNELFLYKERKILFWQAVSSCILRFPCFFCGWIV